MLISMLEHFCLTPITATECEEGCPPQTSPQKSITGIHLDFYLARDLVLFGNQGKKLMDLGVWGGGVVSLSSVSFLI